MTAVSRSTDAVPNAVRARQLGAWLVSDGNAKRADRLYQTGYYYDAKRKGLLEETGLGRDRSRRRLQPDA